LFFTSIEALIRFHNPIKSVPGIIILFCEVIPVQLADTFKKEKERSCKKRFSN